MIYTYIFKSNTFSNNTNCTFYKSVLSNYVGGKKSFSQIVLVMMDALVYFYLFLGSTNMLNQWVTLLQLFFVVFYLY